jgi:predicted hotdog family 3-hydroxylacyl-ACP dehydratase
MLLLSRITAYDIPEGRLAAEYDITEDCVFYDRDLGGVPGWVAFEFIAQGVSAFSGLAGRERGEKPKPGFIISVSDLEVTVSLLPINTTLEIRVREDCRAGEVFTFRGEVYRGEERITRGTLTVIEGTYRSLPEKLNPPEG